MFFHDSNIISIYCINEYEFYYPGVNKSQILHVATHSKAESFQLQQVEKLKTWQQVLKENPSRGFKFRPERNKDFV